MSFRDRLRRLRREQDLPRGNVASALEGTTRAVDSPALSGMPAHPTTASDKPDLGAPKALIAFEGPGGPGEARVTTFDASHRHGSYALDEVTGAQLDDLVLLTGDDSLADLDLEQAIYLDTETTGLSGGAGTYVFQIGLGRFLKSPQGPRFEVWQGFLSGPEGERALLSECARRIADRSGVVSFFGKSFDRHRLEDKMTLCGVPAPFADRPHLDLYHPCRRLYRGAYGDGRLKTLEKELCGVQREDDLPGSEAPEAWFDYLAGRPHQLEGVFRHNLDDVLSLVSLATHLGHARREQRPDGSALEGNPRTRALGISRSAAGRQNRSEALRWIERAIEREAQPVRSLLRERADLLRLDGQSDGAVLAYRELLAAGTDRESVPCLLELAKLLEHHARDLAGALECCRCAAILIESQHTGPEYARLVRDLRKRLTRLEKKVAP